MAELGFGGVEPEVTGRPSYHPSALLKLYIYGYLNRVQSSRRLERDAGHNVEVMWLSTFSMRNRLTAMPTVHRRHPSFDASTSPPRCAPPITHAETDRRYNDMSKLILDVNDRIEAAADDRARGVIIRKLRKALDTRG